MNITDTRAFMDHPGNLDAMLEAIACGGTMLEWCKENDLSYGIVCRGMMEEERKKRLQAAQEIRGEFLSDVVIRNLRAFADFNLADAYGPDGKLLDLIDMPEGMQRAITSLSVTESLIGTGDTASIQTLTKIVTISPEKILALLGKYRKMFVDRIDLAGPDGGPITIVHLPDNHRDDPEKQKED